MDKSIIIKNLHLLNHYYKEQGFMFFSLFCSYARGTEDMFSDIDHNIFFKDNAFAKLAKIEDIKKELELYFTKNRPYSCKYKK